MSTSQKIFAALFPLVEVVNAACSPCVPERVEDLEIPNSEWTAEIWVAACGFGISGPFEVRAHNAATGKTLSVAFTEDPGVKLSIDDSGNLVIALSNVAHMWNLADQIGDVAVRYHFLPTDDAHARSMAQRFWTNPDDKEAKAWWCENVIGTMDAVNRASWTRIVGCYPRNEDGQ